MLSEQARGVGEMNNCGLECKLKLIINKSFIQISIGIEVNVSVKMSNIIV